MSLFIVGGEVGAGKSRFLMEKLWQELMSIFPRYIVTSLPLMRHNLEMYYYEVRENAEPLFDGWCMKEVEEVTALAYHRGLIRVLEPEELREFYLKRQTVCDDVRVISKSERKGNSPVCLDFAPWSEGGVMAGQGVLYLLDELSLVFDNREWQNYPPDLNFYLQQHRKLTDDIYAASPDPWNLDKKFRSYVHNYVWLTNMSQHRFDRYRGKNVLRAQYFKKLPPREGAASVVPMYVEEFGLNSRLNECYNTAAGLGISGVNADKGKKASGMPWWSYIAAVVAIGIGLWLSTILIMKGVVGYARKSIVNASTVAHVTVKPQQIRSNEIIEPHLIQDMEIKVQGNQFSEAVPLKRYKVQPDLKHPEVFMQGYYISGGQMTIMLSDGRDVVAGDPLLTEYGRDHCVYDGIEYRMRYLTESEEYREGKRYSHVTERPTEHEYKNNGQRKVIANEGNIPSY